MSDSKVYYPPEGLANETYISSIDTYNEWYRKSIKQPAEFWTNISSQFHWEVKPRAENALSYNFDLKKGHIFIRWFSDGKTNLCYNCLDRHVKNGLGSKVAFLWEGNDPNDRKAITYQELLTEVIAFGSTLRRMGVNKGDRVAIYMPMVIEQVVAVLACARIGAIHSVVFAGFSAESLSERLISAGSRVLVTCDGAWRGTKLIDLMKVANEAMNICESKSRPLEHCIVLRHLTPEKRFGAPMPVSDCPGIRPVQNFSIRMRADRDVWWDEAIPPVETECPVEWMDAEDGLFILYSSGSTGRPKGLLHTTGGYMVYAATTAKYVFDLHPDDVYWCTADIGWITGHSYLIYGPLLNGVTSVIFEGLPNWPDYGRYWSIVERYRVTKFYTAPTVIRMLIGAGEEHVKKYDRSSLKILGSVGEPINPSTWKWYYEVVGDSRCAIVDTFWQTETGGHMITTLPGAIPMQSGCAGRPFFGVDARIIKNEFGTGGEGGPAKNLSNDKCVEEGYLVFAAPWPGIARTIYGDHKRFEDVYFKRFPGYFMSGDGAILDSENNFWITGRMDDMLNMSGHLLSTFEVESALGSHPLVAEAAAVARHHKVKGECLHCFVTLKDSVPQIITPELRQELVNLVRAKIAPFAAPDYIQAAPALPKTRSGKIIRRILRKIANGDREFGDTSTLADPSCLDYLCAEVEKTR
ncbi:Acetyl-coenzyme A synthetase cytoplasmic [Taenia crassiceps]|uniref:Acetyl-coenzyme A synthetase n=1 Tax=Taenia crassiceps TaxID=6207 RepID=A0ABR4QST9_9CEST